MKQRSLRFNLPALEQLPFARPFAQLNTRFSRLSHWRVMGILGGILLFAFIIFQTNPAFAQLFGTAEEQAQTIFGQYIDQGIIDFLFGMLRIVVWISAVGFVFFAIYQAQRGEQWQPLLQNAFIIIAAVVVVEGLSQLFFGV
ncbi:hypothetical protein [Leptothoe sp. PORK10 BA2]|uniref:hypothetical protein n=1 Tax=Leptothoe sp. PORK10 BA2 TaxID=3110254 RepID=UPI002B202668|nr:hypothetical protein [Leptothoe sp. PORK10 BA2]MEA5464049.1 hypothetical protein [Leptothoe sp. PORK10 BA2]